MINDLSIISNCTQHLPFTLTIPQIPNMPICNLPLAASPILPLQDILTCLTYGINLSFNGLHGLLLFIVKNMPPIIIDNISKGGIYLEIIDRCPINLNYIKYSSSLVKDILIPGLESFKYITTHASIDLTFIEINVIKVVMLKVIIFEIFTTLKHITSIGVLLLMNPTIRVLFQNLVIKMYLTYLPMGNVGLKGLSVLVQILYLLYMLKNVKYKKKQGLTYNIHVHD